MPVEIKIYTLFDPDRTERQQLDQAMNALGFGRVEAAVTEMRSLQSIVRNDLNELQSSTKIAEQEIAASLGHVVMPVSNEVVEQAAAITTRERGQPAPGKSRRTKAEIAEDEAADKADAESQIDEGEMAAASSNAFPDDAQSISSGEERISPEDEADAAQDAADEAAETEATGGLPARERLRKALGSLGIKAGVEAVKPGGLLGMTVDKVPDDEIEAAIARIEASKSAPADKKADEPEAKPATKDDLMQAMLDYAEVYDGTRDPTGAKFAQVDAGKVFQLLFGEAVTKLSAVPTDGYDKAIAGIREAIEKNPFSRERKG